MTRSASPQRLRTCTSNERRWAGRVAAEYHQQVNSSMRPGQGAPHGQERMENASRLEEGPEWPVVRSRGWVARDTRHQAHRGQEEIANGERSAIIRFGSRPMFTCSRNGRPGAGAGGGQHVSAPETGMPTAGLREQARQGRTTAAETPRWSPMTGQGSAATSPSTDDTQHPDPGWALCAGQTGIQPGHRRQVRSGGAGDIVAGISTASTAAAIARLLKGTRASAPSSIRSRTHPLRRVAPAVRSNWTRTVCMLRLGGGADIRGLLRLRSRISTPRIGAALPHL